MLDLQAMVEETKNDPEMHAMTKEEINTCSAQVKEFEKSLVLKLLPKDEADEGDAIIEIRAGKKNIQIYILIYGIIMDRISNKN